MKKSSIIAAAGLLAATASAQSTNSIVISATRIDTPIEQVGSAFSIISSKEIEHFHTQDVQSSLTLAPGIQMTQNGGRGTASSVFIRGANANQTLVLINGIRINGNTTGSFNLSTIPTDSIDRIEVLRGPQSALYGSDAIGGVVNIVTKKGAEKEIGGSLLLEIGKKGYHNGELNLSAGNDVIDINTTLSASGLNQYNISENSGGYEDDQYSQLAFFSDLGLNFATDGRADLVVMYNKNKNELDQTAPYPGWWQVDDLDRKTKNEFRMATLNLSKPITGNFEQSCKAGYNEVQTTGRNNGQREYFYRSRNYDFNTQSDLFFLDSSTVTLGYDFRRSEAENNGRYSSEHIIQNSVYANTQLDIDEQLFLSLGGRYDDYSKFDGKGTWQTSISWFWETYSRLHASAGSGYKTPTMNDLYWPSTSWSIGNPDLNPEESLSFDIGQEKTLFDGKLVMDVTYFQSIIKDMIVWKDNGSGIWIPNNVNNAKSRGVEVSFSAQPTDSFSAKLHYTYTRAIDTGTGNQLARRAQNNAGLSAIWDYSSKGSLSGDIVYVGKRFDNADNTRGMPAYALLNLGTQYQVSESLSLVANVDNLLDKEYETTAGYGTVGRVASVGIEISF